LKSDNPFAEEIGNAFLGIVPMVDKVPEVFIKNNWGTEHAQMVKEYLVKKESGERTGILVAKATADLKEGFTQKTGLNLEALVASIGVAKNGMGLQGRPEWMFGCGLNAANPNKNAGIYSNALCAAQKLDSYVTECTNITKQNDAGCYYEQYNADSENQEANYKNKNDFSAEEFTGIYTAWNSNPFAMQT